MVALGGEAKRMGKESMIKQIRYERVKKEYQLMGEREKEWMA